MIRCLLLCWCCLLGLLAAEGAGYPPASTITILSARGAGGGSQDLCIEMARALERVSGLPVEVRSLPGGNLALDLYLRQPPRGLVLLQFTDSLCAQLARDPAARAQLRMLAIPQRRWSKLFVRSDDRRFADWAAMRAYLQAGQPLRVATSEKVAWTLDHQPAPASPIDTHYVHWLRGLASGGWRQVSDVPRRAPDRFFTLFDGSADALLEQPEDVDLLLRSGLIKPILALHPLRDGADLPTAAGQAGFEALGEWTGFRGFAVHAATPSARLEQLQAFVGQAIVDPAFQQFNARYERDGFRPLIGAAAGAMLDAQIAFQAAMRAAEPR